MKWHVYFFVVTISITLGLLLPNKGYSSDIMISAQSVADSSMPASNELAIFQHKVAFHLPKNWKLAFENIQASMISVELIPEKTSLNEWSEMICIQGFKGIGKIASPKVFLDEMVKSYQNHCQGELVYNKLGDTLVDGQEAYHALVACSQLPNLHQGAQARDSFTSQLQGEVGYFSVVRLEDDLLMLHKSMRGDSFSLENTPLTESNYAEFIDELMLLSIHIPHE